MKHLTTDEINAFVSMRELNEENLKLASRVNAHILKCDECLLKVKALQPDYWEEYTPEMKERVKKTEAENTLQK